MTPDERTACLAALDAAERAAATLRAVLGCETADMVPLAEACRAWGVSKETALKRARRGLGRKIAGRWHVPAVMLPPACKCRP